MCSDAETTTTLLTTTPTTTTPVTCECAKPLLLSVCVCYYRQHFSTGVVTVTAVTWIQCRVQGSAAPAVASGPQTLQGAASGHKNFEELFLEMNSELPNHVLESN